MTQMFGIPMVIAILYVWCNANADVIVSFWFGTKFKVRMFHRHAAAAQKPALTTAQTSSTSTITPRPFLNHSASPSAAQAMYLPWVLAAFNVLLGGR